jgi:MarR family transcriptional regulator, organic hydroperoxide resistance regulator
MDKSAVSAVLMCFSRIYFACHTRHVRDPATGRTLSAHQAGILDHLSTIAPTSLAELASHMGVTASTMSLATDRLEEGGFVRRCRDKSDARRLRLLLTSRGERIRKAHSVLDPQKMKAVLARLSRLERAEAVRGLELLARAAAGCMRIGKELT